MKELRILRHNNVKNAEFLLELTLNVILFISIPLLSEPILLLNYYKKAKNKLCRLAT